MMTYANSFEALSLLKDGELGAADAATLVQALDADVQLRAAWHSYHLIGEALRDADSARGALVHSASAVHHPADQAAARAAVPWAAQPPADADRLALPVLHPAGTQAANDSVFRWKMIAGVASVAAVGALMWSLVGTGSSASLQPQLAQRNVPAASPAAVAVNTAADSARVLAQSDALAPAAAQTAAVAVNTTSGGADAPQTMIRDPRLDELLAAHKQFGNASALQQPAGFLRNATFQTPQR